MNRRMLLKTLVVASMARAGRVQALDALAGGTGPSNFAAIYGDAELRERFRPFLENVFHLYPENHFHDLITRLTRERPGDEAIYRALQEALPAIKPMLADLTYAVPALHQQKAEMTRQALDFVGQGASARGYVEIGAPGRYLSVLRTRMHVEGPVWIVNDVKPGFGPVDVLERGGVVPIGAYVPLGNYDPFAGVAIPEASVDLVVNFIGFHHCPDDRLDGFVGSIRRVLRPGGRLLLRDHDVDDATMWSLVALAHDVFNAGVGLSWDDNRRQVRRFRSIRTWTEYLVAQGFRSSPRSLAQDGDPTRNLMVELVRV